MRQIRVGMRWGPRSGAAVLGTQASSSGARTSPLSPAEEESGLMGRTFFAPCDVASLGEGDGILAGWTGTHQGPVRPPTPTSLNLELSVAVLSTDVWTAVCPAWPPSAAPQGSLESAQFLARFQASCIFADTGSRGCQGWGPRSGLCKRLRQGLECCLQGCWPVVQAGQAQIHSHPGPSP